MFRFSPLISARAKPCLSNLIRNCRAQTSSAASVAVSDTAPALVRRPKVTDEERKVLKDNFYNVHEAVHSSKSFARANFVETVEIAVKLGVDPRKPNQAIKSVAKLPNGSGKKVRVAVFAVGDDAQAARDAGADIVGADDLIKIIQTGDISFDRAISTPEMMIQVSKIGKLLGPKGLMPNPKMGTVTKEVAKAVKSAKAGAVQFRVDKFGIVHAGIGKVNFTSDQILENIRSFMLAINEARPEGYKGKFFETVTLSTTMGPGIKIDIGTVDPSNAKFMLDPSKLNRK